nr:MurR/RpiR family transcriptional regulator [Aerococcus tenax]
MNHTILELLNENYNTLNENELHIAKYIFKHSDEIVSMKVKELADKTYTSKSSIIRFVQKLGFSGFIEFKTQLSIENETKRIPAQTSTQDQLLVDLKGNMDYLKERDWTKFYKFLEECSYIYIFPSGISQKNQAGEIQRVLSLLGKRVQIVDGLDNNVENRSLIRTINNNDMVFILSLSGQRSGSINIAKKAKIIGAKVVSITGYKKILLQIYLMFQFLYRGA